MAATVSESIAQIQKVAATLNGFELFASTNSPNLVDLEQAIIDNIRGSAAAQLLASARAISNAVRPRLEPSAVVEAFTPCLEDMMEAIGKPDRGFAENMVTWRDYLRSEADTVNSRGFAFGTPSAGGGNVGSGVPLRLTKDRDGTDLEGCFSEARSITCVRDQNGGREFEELFLFEGVNKGLGWLRPAGSGTDRLIRAYHAGDTAALVQNPSFSTFNGTAPSAGSPVAPSLTTDVTGWNLSAAASFLVDVDTVFRGFPGDTTPKSLKFVANGSVSQILKNTVNAPINPNNPYALAVALYRKDTATGTFQIDLGAVSQSWSLASLSDNAWSVLALDRDQDLYPDNFNQANLDIVFTLSSLAAGTIYIDDLLFGPMVMVDGLWYLLPGGATSFLRNDVFTWTDSEGGSRAVLQYWLCFRTQISETLGYAFSLPSENSGSETIADS